MKRFILRSAAKPMIPEYEVCYHCFDGVANIVAHFFNKSDAEEYIAWKNGRVSQREIFRKRK